MTKQTGLKLLTLMAVAFGLLSASNSPEQGLEADAIVDQFERLIMERDRKRFMVGEQEQKPEVKTTTEYKFGASDINGSTPVRGDLKSIDTALTKIERGLELLEAEIQSTNARLASASRVKNNVSISAEIATPNATQVRNLTVRVDGVEVMAFSDARGVGLEASSFQVYDGPLKPGKHNVAVEAHLIAGEETTKRNPLNMDVFKHIAENFVLDIPTGEVRRSYAISLGFDAKNNHKPVAQLVTKDAASQPPEKEAN